MFLLPSANWRSKVIDVSRAPIQMTKECQSTKLIDEGV